ncbi:MAG: hypothetical protein LBB49_04990, partial [Gracilibacteraceae bacterium]|nr:hypothetical protein [Gracilibacteraceae bacterium]
MYRFDELVSVADRPTLIGSKAENLIRLREGGFNVPGGFVVTTAELGGLSGTAPSNTFTAETLGAYIDENTAYAVRSSGVGEDLADLSFAGQYDSYLNVKGTASVYEATLKCAQSIHNDRLAAYAQSRGINDISQYPMAVIIQTMVDSDKSGVAFSIDSVNGKDKEILIEAVRGLGDQLVSGQVTPDSYGYHWYDDILTSYQGGVLTEAEVKAVAAVVLDIQVFYGFPVDVEWAIADGSIFILQSRPITAISTRAIPQEWTTADFRDGGVSAAACKPLMASLYGLVFNASFLDSLKTIKLLPTAYQESIYEVFFARPYWRLTLEKECFARLPGFVEREIDEDMGVVPTYTGDGVVTPTTPRTLWRGLLTLRAISRHIKIMGDKAAVRRQELLQRLTTIGSLDLTGRSATDLHKLWIRFVRDDYYTSEYTYFGYIFCNMILSTLFKDKIK